MLNSKKILFFDSDCLFCNRWVQRIHCHALHSDLYFSGLKGKEAEHHLCHEERTSLAGIILVVNGKKYHKGLALRRLFREVNAPLSLLLMLTFICPLFLVNAIYNFIARNRHRINGNNTCEFDPTLQSKILP